MRQDRLLPFSLSAAALLAGSLIGCSLDPIEGDGDAGTGGSGTAGMGGGSQEGGVDGVPKVGDPYDGGTVVDVNTQGDCTILSVQFPERWQCSSEQVAEANAPFDPGDTGGSGGGAATEEEAVALEETTCEGLADLRREALKATQRRQIAHTRHQALQDNCLPRVESRYVDSEGNPTSYCGYPNADGGYGGTGGAGGGSSGGSGGGGTDEYSTTNTQVAGVDEADFIKNDGEFVYVLSQDGLHIIDAWPAPDAHEIAHLPCPGEPRRLYLAGDRLLVYSYMPNGSGSPSPGVPSSQGCTYGYDCRFASEGGRTLARVLDVSNPAQPVEVARYEMSGGYADSRRIGTTVYTVVHDDGVTSVPGVDYSLPADDPEELEETYDARTAAADLAVDSMTAPYFLPWVNQLDASGAVINQVTSCNRALSASAAQGGSFVSVVSLDLAGASPPARAIVATKPGFVYASSGALYFATDGVDGRDSYAYADAQSDRSTIHKFHLAGLDVSYVGSTGIRGHVLNQFSMDEYQGVLRVATSSGWVPDPLVSSSITTIHEDTGGGLSVLGELTGLAPTEDIRAVRFDGDRGFVVTFKKTDPLFVIGLSNPSQPVVLGELKIPGFSTYMHRLDANHLLAVGFDADDHGDFAYFDGILIQIFDVTDLATPLLLHKTVIGTRGSGSEALLNHLAFNYFPPKQMLALPMTICEGGNDGTFGDEMTFAGLMVFDVALASGIAEHGRMPFVDPSQSSTYYECGKWWTDAHSMVKRSIFMGDYAIGLSDTTMNVAALSDLDNVLQSIPLVAATP